MKVTDWKIGTRLGLGFAAVLLLLVFVAGIGIGRMAQIQENLTEISEVNNVQLKLATAMRDTVTDRMIALRNLALLNEMSEMQPQFERIKEGARKYAEAEEKLGKMFFALAGTTADEKAMLSKIKEVETAILPVMGRAAELAIANKADEATKALMVEVRPLQNKWVSALGELIALEEKLNEQASVDAAKAYTSARLLMFILSGVAIVLGALIAWLVTGSITRPLGEAVKIAQTVASGDLSSQRAGPAATGTVEPGASGPTACCGTAEWGWTVWGTCGFSR